MMKSWKLLLSHYKTVLMCVTFDLLTVCPEKKTVKIPLMNIHKWIFTNLTHGTQHALLKLIWEKRSLTLGCYHFMKLYLRLGSIFFRNKKQTWWALTVSSFLTKSKQGEADSEAEDCGAPHHGTTVTAEVNPKKQWSTNSTVTAGGGRAENRVSWMNNCKRDI